MSLPLTLPAERHTHKHTDTEGRAQWHVCLNTFLANVLKSKFVFWALSALLLQNLNKEGIYHYFTQAVQKKNPHNKMGIRVWKANTGPTIIMLNWQTSDSQNVSMLKDELLSDV